jgi:hypothetical protein
MKLYIQEEFINIFQSLSQLLLFRKQAVESKMLIFFLQKELPAFQVFIKSKILF